MDSHNVTKIRDELECLMREQVESLDRQVFVGLSREEARQQAGRLKRIREVSADFLAALKNNSRVDFLSDRPGKAA